MPRFLVILLTLCCVLFLLLVVSPFVSPILFGLLLVLLAEWKLWLSLLAAGLVIAVVVDRVRSGPAPADPPPVPKPDPRLRIAPPASQAAPRAERRPPVAPAPQPEPQPEPPMQLPPVMTEAEAQSARIDAALDAWRRELAAKDQNSRP